jgi:hypothetical protein
MSNECRDAQLNVYTRGRDLLAVIRSERGLPAGFVFAPWPWPWLDWARAPRFGGKGFTRAAIDVIEGAIGASVEVARRIDYQQAFRWTFGPHSDDFGGDVFGHPFDRLLVRDALAALVGAGARQDIPLTIELITLPLMGWGSDSPLPHKGLRITQWLASTVVCGLLPGTPTEGPTLTPVMS